MTETTLHDLQEIVISTTLDARPDRVFRAWTTPEEFAQWFTAEGFTTPAENVDMDVRDGGSWKATMVADDGSMEIPFFGVYREVVEGEKLVYSMVDGNDDGVSAETAHTDDAEAVTVTFAQRDGGTTEMLFRQVGRLPAEELPRATEGWKSFFANLAVHVAA